MKYENIFEEAFHPTTGKIFFINELTDLIRFDENYRKEFANELLCPYCQKALLTFVDMRHPYLRIKNGSSHSEDCPFKLNVMGTVFEEYVGNSHNFSEIYRYIKEFTELIFDNSKNAVKPLSTIKMMSAPKDEKVTSNLLSHRILIKNVNNNVSKNDFFETKLFYGQIYFDPKCKSTAKKQFLHIISPKTQKSICSLNMDMVFYNKIIGHTPISENVLYNIAFIGKIHGNEKSKFYYDIDLISPYHLFIMETNSENSSENIVM